MSLPFPVPIASSATIIKAILEGPEGMELARCAIMGVDGEGTEVIPAKVFQWWPDQMTDAIQTGWNPKTIPGMSHPLQVWGSNGGRTLSFEVVLSRLRVHADDLSTVQAVEYAGLAVDTEDDINRDVEDDIAYLRAFCYPSYQYDEEGFTVVDPPPIALLNFPMMNLNENGDDIIWCVMTGCDVTYLRSFPNGRPRLAKVSLTFSQTKQDVDGLWNAGLEDFEGRKNGLGRLGNATMEVPSVP
ncbi:MAG: hypothetical protein DRP09_15715 [Candidatus Thorarchaeota archaeon]|nr:MAG: hypothetical protein DRP09_15715 [Candidatus Thorarchaeota archaeon]